MEANSAQPGAKPAPGTAHPLFPFTAIVGQEQLRQALILLAVRPDIGGLLIKGDKGTAKSTAVRALASVMPAVSIDAPGMARVVELPLGATEDRVVGSIDVERMLTDGSMGYRPGVLAEADHNILYVDEVNLLADHLVDAVLDSAASGIVSVERDGISHRAPARFALVGTMNPEEGELRPQLLDRFGLCVTVRAPADPVVRADIVRGRLKFDTDPAAFLSTVEAAERDLAARICSARERALTTQLPDKELLRIALVCTFLQVEGLRSDIVMARCALAAAAWRGATEVQQCDVRVAAHLALPHRRHRDPFDPADSDPADIDQALDDASDQLDNDPDQDPDSDGRSGPDGDGESPSPDGSDNGGSDGTSDEDGSNQNGGSRGGGDTAGSADEDSQSPLSSEPDLSEEENSTTADSPQSDTSTNDDGSEARSGTGVGDAAHADRARSAAKTRRLVLTGTGHGAGGRRSAALTDQGRVVASGDSSIGVLDIARTAGAAALRRAVEKAGAPRSALSVARDDLRFGTRHGKEGNLIVFLVDTSGSMGARKRLDAVTGTVIAVLRDAYTSRDIVSVVTARGHEATVAVPPTRSVQLAVERLNSVPTGGRTPIAEGITAAGRVIMRHAIRDPRRRALLVVLTDGRATSGPNARTRAESQAHAFARCVNASSIVVDCENGPIRLGLAATLARALTADLMTLDDLVGWGTHRVGSGPIKAA